MRIKSNVPRNIRLKYIILFIVGLVGFLIYTYISFSSTFSSSTYGNGNEDPSPAPMMINFTSILIPLIIFLTIFIVVLAMSYVNTSKRYSQEPYKLFKKRPSVSISYAKNHNSSNIVRSSDEILDEIQNREKLIQILDDEKFNEKIEMTLISEESINKIEVFDWKDEEQKIEFIKEIFSLTPKEREEIIEYMLENSKKNELI